MSHFRLIQLNETTLIIELSWMLLLIFMLSARWTAKKKWVSSSEI